MKNADQINDKHCWKLRQLIFNRFAVELLANRAQKKGDGLVMQSVSLSGSAFVAIRLPVVGPFSFFPQLVDQAEN